MLEENFIWKKEGTSHILFIFQNYLHFSSAFQVGKEPKTNERTKKMLLFVNFVYFLTFHPRCHHSTESILLYHSSSYTIHVMSCNKLFHVRRIRIKKGAEKEEEEAKKI